MLVQPEQEVNYSSSNKSSIMPEPIIVACTISKLPKTFFDPMPDVIVTFDNGEKETLFSYYPDEISFSEKEFIGLTAAQGHQLKFKKDLKYLKS